MHALCLWWHGMFYGDNPIISVFIGLFARRKSETSALRIFPVYKESQHNTANISKVTEQYVQYDGVIYSRISAGYFSLKVILVTVICSKLFKKNNLSTEFLERCGINYCFSPKKLLCFKLISEKNLSGPKWSFCLPLSKMAKGLRASSMRMFVPRGICVSPWWYFDFVYRTFKTLMWRNVRRSKCLL